MKIVKKFNLRNGRNAAAAATEKHFPAAGNELKNLRHKGISRSLSYMAQHYTRPIQMRDLVDISGMSSRGLIKAFNRHIGRPPGALIRQARIEFAKRLLMEQDLPLKTIAATVGFRSQNTFCVAFTRATGLAPKKFQRQVWLSVFNTVARRQK